MYASSLSTSSVLWGEGTINHVKDLDLEILIYFLRFAHIINSDEQKK